MTARNPRGRPKGSLNKINRSLKEMILGALKAKDGQRYLEKIAEEDPRTFCALLGRVLPLTVTGEVTQNHKYEVTLVFGQGENDLSPRIQGATVDDKALVHMRCS